MLYFEYEYYVNRYKDLSHMNKEQALRHFIKHGIKEKRKFNKLLDSFDYNYYITKYKDLSKMNYLEACNHYIKHGINEKRQCNITIASKKKTIYFLLCNISIIKPNSGDQITEISIMKCLSLYYDVYYNNQLINFNKPNYGLTKTIIEPPNKKYDYYWIRNNDEILLKCDGIKIRCGAPYNIIAYEKSDIIICYTKSWEDKLKNYNKKYVESGNLYPISKICLPKNILTVYQTIEDRFYNTFDSSTKLLYRNKLVTTDCDLLIGHFGRVSESCYPKYLLPAFDRLCENYPNKKLKLIFCGKNAHFRIPIKTNNPHVIIKLDGVDYNEIDKYIKSCDLITSDYNSPTANWGGCMHIIESMACGIPIICGNFDVRIEQLGHDYPFFWNKDLNDVEIINEIYNILVKILINDYNKLEIITNLIERSKFYKKNNIAKNINLNLEKILY